MGGSLGEAARQGRVGMKITGIAIGSARFGWHSDVHEAIEKAAHWTLESSWLKEHTQKHHETIQFHDDNQDSTFRGPGHYINWGARSNTGNVTGKSGNVWSKALNYFTPKQRRCDKALF